MEWDKIWALNRSIIDPISPRFFAVKKEKISTLELTNVTSNNIVQIPLFPKVHVKRMLKNLTNIIKSVN